MARFAGIPVVESPHATVSGGYYFKPSPYRSKRLHKKLLKRYGAQEKPRVPAALLLCPKTPKASIIAHPLIVAEWRQQRFDDAPIVTIPEYEEAEYRFQIRMTLPIRRKDSVVDFAAVANGA